MDTLKIILRSALWWILCCCIAFLSVYLQIHFSTPTGEYGSGMLASELCDVNWVLWAIGMVLGLGGFAAVWHRGRSCIRRHFSRSGMPSIQAASPAAR